MLSSDHSVFLLIQGNHTHRNVFEMYITVDAVPATWRDDFIFPKGNPGGVIDVGGRSTCPRSKACRRISNAEIGAAVDPPKGSSHQRGFVAVR